MDDAGHSSLLEISEHVIVNRIIGKESWFLRLISTCENIIIYIYIYIFTHIHIPNQSPFE